MKRISFASVVLLMVTIGVLGVGSSQASPMPLPIVPTFLSYEWTKAWGGPSNEAVHNIAVDPSGNLYLIGEFAGTVDFDPDPVKTDNHTSANGTTDAFLSKFTSDGIFLWAKTWGGGPTGGSGMNGRDVANGVVVDSVGNVYVSGPFQYSVDFNPDPAIDETHTSNAGSMNNIYLSKFSPEGIFQWVRTWGPTDAGGESYSLAIDGSDHIYVVGDFSGTTTNFDPWDPEHPDWHANHQPSSGPVFFDAILMHSIYRY